MAQDDFKTVHWDGGKPYWQMGNGSKYYIPPAIASQTQDNPQLLDWAKQQGYYIDDGGQGQVHMGDQGGGIWKTTGQWDPQSGDFDQGIDWGNVLTAVVAGVMTAGAATAALGGTPAAEAAVSTAASTGDVTAGLSAGTAAAAGTGGTLASTTIAPTIGAIAPGVVASGAVPAALETGTAIAGGVGADAALEPLASHAIAPTATPLAPGVAPSGMVPAALGTTTATGLTTAQKIAQGLQGAGQAVGAATNQAAQNRIEQNDPYLKRSQEEDKQRRQALIDVYRDSWYKTRQPGPYDKTPLQPLSADAQSSMDALAAQGKTKLANPAQYDTSNLPSLAPGTLEQVGNWLAPTLSTIGTIAKFL